MKAEMKVDSTVDELAALWEW
jgi:hypothetical protein